MFSWSEKRLTILMRILLQAVNHDEGARRILSIADADAEATYAMD